MASKLKNEGLAERLPLLNVKAVAQESGVDYERLRNFNYGRIKALTDEELLQIQKALKGRKLFA